MPAYVVLHHRSGPENCLPRRAKDHFDWLFDHGEALWTWATDSLPEPSKPATMSAVRLADHRREYLRYEGPLSGQRGEVARVEWGVFEVRRAESAHYEFALRGDRAGTVTLQRMRSELKGNGGELWYWSFLPVRAEAS